MLPDNIRHTSHGEVVFEKIMRGSSKNKDRNKLLAVEQDLGETHTLIYVVSSTY